MTINHAAIQTDAYKLFHQSAYKDDIVTVYSNMTSRNNRLSNIPKELQDGVVFVGNQYFCKDVLIDEWNKTFFNLPFKKAINNFQRIADSVLGFKYDSKHVQQLHELGYLPISIKALPEGSVVPYGVPSVTFTNTHQNFRWLPNFLETVYSTENWGIQTSATTSRAYRKQTIKAFDKAGLSHDLIPFMNHDFSMRGMFGRHAAAMSGFGHLTSSAGTDTLPAIAFAEKYYNADCTKELVGVSVNATEHSTATSYIMDYAQEYNVDKLESEIEYVKYLFSKAPTGILSHVSDSFDFWKFVTTGLPILKKAILAREGKFVIRPDSGDPVKILTGYKLFVAQNFYDLSLADLWNDGYEAVCFEGVIKTLAAKQRFGQLTIYLDKEISKAESKGLIECLWDIFSGTVNEAGFKILDDHIGAIYGDSITLERQNEIYTRLINKGFAPLVVLGIGSYSYQFVTRDTHSSAVKATWVEKSDGTQVNVCKDPATDSKKKSLKGLIRIEKENKKYIAYDQQTPEQEQQGELVEVFRDGKLLIETSLEEIRQRLQQTY